MRKVLVISLGFASIFLLAAVAFAKPRDCPAKSRPMLVRSSPVAVRLQANQVAKPATRVIVLTVTARPREGAVAAASLKRSTVNRKERLTAAPSWSHRKARNGSGTANTPAS